VVKRVIDEWLTFYNGDRPDKALKKRTLDEAYFGDIEMMKAAC